MFSNDTREGEDFYRESPRGDLDRAARRRRRSGRTAASRMWASRMPLSSAGFLSACGAVGLGWRGDASVPGWLTFGAHRSLHREADFICNNHGGGRTQVCPRRTGTIWQQ